MARGSILHMSYTYEIQVFIQWVNPLPTISSRNPVHALKCKSYWLMEECNDPCVPLQLRSLMKYTWTSALWRVKITQKKKNRFSIRKERKWVHTESVRLTLCPGSSRTTWVVSLPPSHLAAVTEYVPGAALTCILVGWVSWIERQVLGKYSNYYIAQLGEREALAL